MRYVAHGLLFFALSALGAIAGDVVIDGTFTSTQVAGPPLEVASTDMVVNLNADMVDGIEGTDLYTKAEVDAIVEPRKYYLRMGPLDGDEVLSACATGFHTANLFEFSQLSNLGYASDQPDGYTGGADRGTGAPAQGEGWIRTGTSASPSSTPGRGNYWLWTSDDVADSGTVVRLSSEWASPLPAGYAQVLGTPWAARTIARSDGRGIWCIED